MPRVRRGFKARQRRNKVLKMAKGYVGGRRKLYRTAVDSVQRSLAFAYRDRKVKKREFRKLWIVRINAAVREHGLSYSRFIDGLNKAKVAPGPQGSGRVGHQRPRRFRQGGGAGQASRLGAGSHAPRAPGA